MTRANAGGSGMASETAARRRTLALWIAWMAGPLAWAIHLGASYPLVYWVCATGRHGVLHLLTGVTLLLTGGACWLAWRLWRTVDRRWPDDGGSATARMRFMAASGVVFSVLFAVAIAAEGIPSFILDACR